MQKFGRFVALALVPEGEQAEEFRQKARAYCEKHGYVLWHGDISQDQGREPHIALDWVREIMNALAIHLLLLPSIQSIHPTNMGYLLNFLIEAQEHHVEVMSLEPTPTRLDQYTLALVPWTPEQQAAGVASLPDIIRCFRLR